MELSKKIVPGWVDIEYEGEKLEFLCAPLTAPQYLNCSQAMEGDASIMAIRYAVRDWRGFTRNGEPVKFSQRELDTLFSDVRRIDLLGELGSRILVRSTPSEQERKN